MKTRQYSKLNRRVLNVPSGAMGTIIDAQPNGKTGWKVTVQWDGSRGSTADGSWTQRDFSETRGNALNLIVPDCFVPDWGPIPERIEALIARIDKGDVKWRLGYGTEGRVGRDCIHIWRPLATFEVSASLYGDQGRWDAKSHNSALAWADLREKLVKAREELQP